MVARALLKRFSRFYMIFVLSLGFLFLTSPIAEVLAVFSYVDISSSQSSGYPDLTYTVHSATGRLVKLSQNSTHLYANVISTTGTLLATTTIDTIGSATYYLKASISSYNTTAVLIIWIYGIYGGAQYSVTVDAALYHLTTFQVHGASSINPESASGTSRYSTMSNIWTYGGNFFTTILIDNVVGNLNRDLVLFNSTTHVLTKNDETNIGAGPAAADFNPNIISYQDMEMVTSGRYAYIVYGTANPTTPDIARVDMESLDIATIATFGVSNLYGITRYVQHMGSGTFEDGSDVYLYFTWEYTRDEGALHIINNRIVQWRLLFNDTELLPSHLVDQNYRYANFTTYYTTTPWWFWGFEVDKSTIEYYWYYETQYGTAKVGARRQSITTWTDMVSQIWDTSVALYGGMDDPTIFPYKGKTDVIGRDPNQQFQVSEDGTNMRIFYGLSLLGTGEYDLTMSYYPADIPLSTTTTYEFQASGTQNAQPFQHFQQWFFDGVNIASKATGAGGYSKVSIVGTTGVHNITVSMYTTDGSTYLYSESWTYAWQVPVTPTPSPGSTTITGAIQLMSAIPALFVMIVPILGLSRIKNIPPVVAIVGGLVIGLVVGAYASLIPPYMIFLGVLGIAIIFVYIVANR